MIMRVGPISKASISANRVVATSRLGEVWGGTLSEVPDKGKEIGSTLYVYRGGPISVARISGKRDEHISLGRGFERKPVISS